MKFLYVLLLLCLWQSGSSQVLNLTDKNGNSVGIQVDEILLVRPLNDGGANIQYGDPAINQVVAEEVEDIATAACGKLVQMDIKEKPGTSKVTAGVLIPVKNIQKHISNTAGKGLLSVRGPRNKISVYETVDTYATVAALIEACFTGSGGGGGVAIPLQRIPFGTGPSLTSDADLLTDGNNVWIGSTETTNGGRLSVQGAVFGGQFNTVTNDVARGSAPVFGAAFGQTNKLFSWNGFAAGTSNYVDGKISGAIGNTNISSSNDGLAEGNRTVTGRRMYAVTSQGVSDPGLGSGSKAYIIIPASEGNVRGFFPNAENCAEGGFLAAWYQPGASCVSGNIYAPEHAGDPVVNLQWALHPYMIVRDAVSEVGITQTKILKTTYSGGVGTTIWYDSPTSLYGAIAFVYSSYSPSVRVNGTYGGNGGHSEGILTSAWGYGSHVGGQSSKAWGDYSFAQGLENRALGRSSTALGEGVWAQNFAEATLGKYNELKAINVDGALNPIFTIGNGTGDVTRSTAFDVLGNGNTNSYFNSYLKGKAGIGRQPSSISLHIQHDGASASFTFANGLQVDAYDATTARTRSGRFFTENNGAGGRSLVYAASPTTSAGLGEYDIVSEGGTQLIATTGGASGANNYILYDIASVPKVRLNTNGNSYFVGGNVGFGTSGPAFPLDVNGTANMLGFKMITGATNGYVLTADATGVGTWQPAAGGGGGSVTGAGSAGRLPYWRTSGNMSFSPLMQLDSANVRLGIGLTAPLATIHVRNLVASGTAQALRVDSSSVELLNVNNLGQVGFGKHVNLGTNAGFSVLVPGASGLSNNIIFTNTFSGDITAGVVGVMRGVASYAGTNGFTLARALEFFALNSSTDVNNDVVGIATAARNVGASSRGNALTGVLSDAWTQQTGSSTLANLYVYKNDFWGTTGATSTITNAYGFKLANLLNSGTITNAYGVYLGDMTTGTQTLAYSFLATDPNATNGFSGNTMIGGTATGTAARALHVNGEMRITDLTTDAPVDIVGADADGDLARITLGTGFTAPGGVLTYAGPALMVRAWNDITGTGTVTASSTITYNRYDNGDQATLTVNLPASPVDGQECTLAFFDTVTTLTISGNGNTIYGTSITTAALGTTISFIFSTGDGWFVKT